MQLTIKNYYTILKIILLSARRSGVKYLYFGYSHKLCNYREN